MYVLEKVIGSELDHCTLIPLGKISKVNEAIIIALSYKMKVLNANFL